jgi:hypothetical protein
MNLRLTKTAIGAGTYNAEFVCQRLDDETGILQVEEALGGVQATIHGRASEEAPWEQVSGRDSAGAVAEQLIASGYLSEIPIFPLMKVECNTSGASTTFSMWFIE